MRGTASSTKLPGSVLDARLTGGRRSPELQMLAAQLLKERGAPGA